MPDTLTHNMFVEQPFQTTVQRNACLDGIGLHSGRFVRMVICPAPASTGIKFCRTDVNRQLQTVIAHASYAQRARLCTRIMNNDGITLETIEHLMAAFSGVGLDNAIIQIDSSEAPILDGSSQPLLESLTNAGLEILPAKRKYMIVTKPVEVRLECGAWARLEPAKKLQIDVEIEFEDSAIGAQKYSYTHRDGSFAAEIAYARTFCQLRDVELMHNAGLALGGSLNNAIVVNNGEILNKGGLRDEREFVKHKVLDCLGDLFLIGMPVKTKMTTFRPGHALSLQLVQTLLNDPTAYRIVGALNEYGQSDNFVIPDRAAASMA
ncbi:UDP-3-O-acyl-N-acetylglucosamine deacetylase [Candidatus Puniceispirillum sp.]|nr:UDP-3-O-acyl-N-acetylglucosamine deacetylase [Candidatus Puniceispirillum sp.]